ncbi:xylose isomerase-like protein [Lyophyllum atratum]|nr:xylose isomerase-like protein [Lyophyllum atratum]
MLFCTHLHLRRVVICKSSAYGHLVGFMAKTRSSSSRAQQEESSEPPLKRIKLANPPVAETRPEPAPRTRRTKASAPIDTSSFPERVQETHPKPAPRTKRSKASAGIDTSSFPERVTTLWKVGAHVSTVKGVENAILNAAAIGANAFALFVKSQRKWISPPLKPECISSFKARMVEYGYTSDFILPHGSYLINLGNPDAHKREKSYQCFLDDLQRCEQLGLTLYNFHPGSTVGDTSMEHSISLVAESINRAHKETARITIVLENMAGAGNIIGGDFSHLGQIISQVEDKSRVGVCLDTCHMFAAGYDIRKKEDWDATLDKFDAEVGLTYLRGMHLNDSKTAHNSKKDRHESIGIGQIGIHAFHHILNDPRVQNIPLVLETPSYELPLVTWTKEIETLNRLSGLALDSVTSQGEEIVKGIELAVKQAAKVGKLKVKASARKATRRRAKADVHEEEEEDGATTSQGEEIVEGVEVAVTQAAKVSKLKVARKSTKRRAKPDAHEEEEEGGATTSQGEEIVEEIDVAVKQAAKVSKLKVARKPAKRRAKPDAHEEEEEDGAMTSQGKEIVEGVEVAVKQTAKVAKLKVKAPARKTTRRRAKPDAHEKEEEDGAEG